MPWIDWTALKAISTSLISTRRKQAWECLHPAEDHIAYCSDLRNKLWEKILSNPFMVMAVTYTKQSQRVSVALKMLYSFQKCHKVVPDLSVAFTA